MKTEPCFYVGTHHYSFRPNQPAEIIGVKMVTPMRPYLMGESIEHIGHEPRPCFHLRYEDGREDYCPISDNQHYKLIGESSGKFPANVSRE